MPRIAALAFLAAALTPGAGAQPDDASGRIRQLELEDAQLAGAAGAVVLVRSFSEIGAAGTGRIVEDAGSGVLVTPCHVLTARHVLGVEESALAPVSRTFSISLSNRAHDGSPAAGFSVLPARLVEQGGQKGARRSALFDDWAILELSSPIAGFAPLPLLPGNCCGARAQRAALAGFPGDLSDPEAPEMWIDPDCAITRKLANRIVVTDCAATSGNSGGPILVLSETGWALAAMLTRAPASPSGGPVRGADNYALPIDRFLKGRIADLAASCEIRLAGPSP